MMKPQNIAALVFVAVASYVNDLIPAKLTLDFDLDELTKEDARNLIQKDMLTPKTTSTLHAKTEVHLSETLLEKASKALGPGRDVQLYDNGGEAALTNVQSSYVGHGPEFQHILLRLSGHSPLVAHFLNMKKIAGRSLSTAGPKMICTEISKNPPPSPTYQDLIKETKKQSKERHQKIIDLHEQTQKALATLRRERIQFNNKIDRLKKKLSNGLEDKIESIPSKSITKVKETKKELQKSSLTEAETDTDIDDDYKDNMKCHENLCVLQFSQELLPIITIEKVE